MTVNELIEILETCPGHGEVLIRTIEGGIIRVAGAWNPSNMESTIIYHYLSEENK